MTFRAAVLEQLNQPLAIHDLEIPPLDVGQVLVRVHCSGICGAQLGEQAGVKGPDKYLPHLMGHEGAGVVDHIGQGVRSVKPGDHVVLHWRKGLGIESRVPRYSRQNDGSSVGAGSVTTFNEYAVVSENRLTAIGPDIPFEIAALMGCAVTTGLGVVTNEARVRIGESVIVLGCGGVGLNVIQAARLVSANPVVAVDLNKEKAIAAIRAGADIGIFAESEEDRRAQIAESLPAGADVVIDTTGNPDVIRLAWELTAGNGRLCLVAQVRHDRTIALQTLPMHSGKTLIASDGGRTDPGVDIPRYLGLYRAGKLKLDHLITHRAPLSGVNMLLDQIRAGKVSRAVITMEN